MASVSMWIETSFTKHECIKFIPSLRDNAKCCCGQLWQYHRDGSPATIRGDYELQWTTSRHTHKLATDAYGTIEFYGGGYPTKGKYLRLSHDTQLFLLDELLSREWGLGRPKLLITIHGGKTDFDIKTPNLKKLIRRGLLKASKTTGAWIITAGTNTGVSRFVGDTLASDSKQQTSGVVTIGICPWGIVEGRHELIGRNIEVPYYPKNHNRSRYASLNSQHKYLLLVDNGTAGKYGSETELRRRLEHYISQQHMEAGDGIDIPIVCLIMEGGSQTIKEVLHYVTACPPVPVIICDGTGRAADLIAKVYSSNLAGCCLLDNMCEAINHIEETFQVRTDVATGLYFNLKECMKRKHLITIFGMGDQCELDQCILSALLQDKKLSSSEQLSLALTWDRVDVARKVIFSDAHDWPQGSLEHAMMEALVNERVEFVKLLLEQGVTMKTFLTPKRLEELYNGKGPPNTLRYIIKDVRKSVTKDYQYTLIDIGLAINKLMGGAFRSTYTRKKFVQNYKIKKTNWYHPLASASKKDFSESWSQSVFEYPFSELMVWAVLTKRHSLALLMWQQGEEALAKALIAAKLYKSLAYEAADDDLATEVYEKLCEYSKEFDILALDFLDFSYQRSKDLAQQLLTYELKNWSKQTCLSLAVGVNHKALLAHPSCQVLLADLWLGGLKTRKNTSLKVLMALVVPLFIPWMGFRSGEELRTMPQRFEEHWDDHYEDRSDSESDSDSDDFPPHHGDPETIVAPRGDNAHHMSLPRRSRTCSMRTSEMALPQSEPHYPTMMDASLVPTRKSLPIKTKLYEFYHAPITKFWAHSIAYLIFLCIHTYVCLVRLPVYPDWKEWYMVAYTGTFLMEKIREIIAAEAVTIGKKLAVWANMWNVMDFISCVAYLFAFHLRLYNGVFRDIGRVTMCVGVVYWYIKALEYLSANKYFGPYITMMGKMVKTMCYFVTLLLTVLMAFGVCRQSILFPNEEPHWRLARHIFYQPYFMLYGEVFAGDIDPPCGGEGETECHPGRWITPIMMSVFLLVANIVLINMLIAAFNNIFITVNTVAKQVWKFQRYRVVMAFEEKPMFPPPLICLSHIYRLFQSLRLRCLKKRYARDHGLKCFLSDETLEQLHDFEMECTDGYLVNKSQSKDVTAQEANRILTEKIETVSTRMEEVNSKFQEILSVLKNMENRRVETPVRPPHYEAMRITSPPESAMPSPTFGTPKCISVASLNELFDEKLPKP